MIPIIRMDARGRTALPKSAIASDLVVMHITDFQLSQFTDLTEKKANRKIGVIQSPKLHMNSRYIFIFSVSGLP